MSIVNALLGAVTGRDLGDTPNQLVPPRPRPVGSVSISSDSALRMSALWACLRLRADLISTMPLDVYRTVAGLKVEAAGTPFLDDPAGDGYGVEDWLYSSQVELDRTGNNVGIIHARDAMGYPAVVELTQTAQVQVKGKGPTITEWRIGGKKYDPVDVWHERQFTLPGVPLGLSPVAYAAWTLGGYLSAQQFGLEWFANGRIPAGKLKNNDKTVNAGEAKIIKDRFRAAVDNRDLFVHGKDWDYDLISVQDGESQFLDAMRFGINDIARFLGVPGDLIEAETQSSAKITYANITQRHLQFLILNLGPSLIRRERKLSRALPKPRFVEFDTDALLRMDPQTLATVQKARIDARTETPTEARAENNRPPLTPADKQEFYDLFGHPDKQPQPTRQGAN